MIICKAPTIIVMIKEDSGLCRAPIVPEIMVVTTVLIYTLKRRVAFCFLVPLPQRASHEPWNPCCLLLFGLFCC